MDPIADVTGQHGAFQQSAFHFHADSGLGTALLANLGVTTATTLAFADSALKIILNGVMAIAVTLAVGYINRLMARRDLAALIAQEKRMREEAARTAAVTAADVVSRSNRPPPPSPTPGE